ncbi:MAG: MFS transporter, partial [Bacilli bacterium]
MEQNKVKEDKIGLRMWLVIILIGLAGQFAWAIENMYLNTYITYLNFTDPTGVGFDYNTCIAITTALSAITATLTTIFMGSLTDKIGKRKLFVSIGYIVWGIATASFGLLNVNSANELIPIAMAASMAAIMVIVIDCIMTFFGSTANDAAFNSYITENISKKNKAKAEGVLSILPLIAMLAIFVGLNGLTTKAGGNKWDIFFYIIGASVLVVGIISFFLIPKETNVKNNEKLGELLIYGFKPSTIKENKKLYLTLLVYFIYAVANQVFFPYLMVYIERTCGIDNSGTGGLLTPFAIVMAIALLGGSLGSVVLGNLADKKGKRKMIIPSLLVFMAGIFLMFFINKIGDDSFKTVYCSVSALIMILGYVGVPTIINSMVREFIPSGKEGSFMGVRMLFVVALPMCIGPFIGSALNNAYGEMYSDPEYPLVTSPVPSSWAYIVAVAILLLAFIPVFFLIKEMKTGEKKNQGHIYSIPEDSLPKIDDVPLSEYPRVNLKRDSYLCLNGKWDFEMTKSADLPKEFTQKILVPFAVESKASGIEKLVEPDDFLYYQRKVDIPEGFSKNGGTLLLHFDGVDQTCDVYIDGQKILSHVGGYTKFTVEVPNSVQDSFLLTLRVKDVTDQSYHQRGKQRLVPNGWFYTSSSGIYFPVWMECVPENYIQNVFFTPDYDNSCVKVKVITEKQAKVCISFEEIKKEINSNEEVMIPLEKMHPWNTFDPYLYDVVLKTDNDSVASYFGIRKIEIKENGKYKAVFLNGKKIFLSGLLDQGYFFVSNLTPLSYTDYLADIRNAKNLGFNVLRKHIKIEEDLFYYYCDREGMLLIQDFPCGGKPYNFFHTIYPRVLDCVNDYKLIKNYRFLSRQDEEGRKEFDSEADQWTDSLNNYPSIIIYTIFNEGWG